MKPIVLSLALGAFLYCQGFQAQVLTQYTPTTYSSGSPQTGYLVPSPSYGYDSPSPSYGYDSPSPAYGYDSPSPAYGYDSPSPTYDYDSPSPTYGSPSPSPIYGYPSPPPPVYSPGSGNGGTYSPGAGNGGTYSPGAGNGGTYSPGAGNGGTYSPGSGSGGTYSPGSGNGGAYSPGSGSGGIYSPGSGNGGTGTGPILSPPGPILTPPPTPFQGGCPKPPAGPRVPPVGWERFQSNPATAYNFTAGECKQRCNRKSVINWTPEQWCLYAQLFNEANRRGYVGDMVSTHQLDGQVIDGKRVQFHEAQAFFPWHRFFVSHFEQLLQKIDHEINPGKADQRGEFCLGYWDWRQSDDLFNKYAYLFNEGAVGSLRRGSNKIPDGAFQDLAVPMEGRLTDVLREPRASEDNWPLEYQDVCDKYEEFGNEDNDGMHDCWEGVHGSVHVQVGGAMGLPPTASADPIFYLHHTMVDFVWNRWQQTHSRIPDNFNAVQPLPYDKWTLNDAVDVSDFCFIYEGIRPMQARIASTDSSRVSTDLNKIDDKAKAVVEKILSKRPVILSKSEFEQKNPFRLAMAKSAEQVDNIYASYVKNARIAQEKYDVVERDYGTSYSQTVSQAPTSAPGTKSFPVASPPPAVSDSGDAYASTETVDILDNLVDFV